MIRLFPLLILLLLAGCVARSAYRPSQTFRFRFDPALPADAVVTFESAGRTNILHQTDGLFAVDLAGRNYGTAIVLVVPLDNNPERGESIIATTNGVRVVRTLRAIRHQAPPENGIFVIRPEPTADRKAPQDARPDQ